MLKRKKEKNGSRQGPEKRDFSKNEKKTPRYSSTLKLCQVSTRLGIFLTNLGCPKVLGHDTQRYRKTTFNK